MKKGFPKITLTILLPLPFVVFAMVVAAISLRHAREMASIMSLPFMDLFAADLYYIVGAFVICLTAETILFLRAVTSYRRKAEELQDIAKEQEKGAHMLVRRDVELTTANDRLRRLDDVKSGFISVVAHQLRTPLSGIKWTLNLLISGDMGALTTEQKTFLMKAYESNDRMISLVNDMLGADRIESGKARYAFLPVRLADIVDNVLFELLPQAKAKGILMRFTPNHTEVSKVKADPEKLRAVFQNLLENSIKYSRTGGTVEIGMERTTHNEIRVSIKDNGIGIPKDQQKNIFERFFRAQNAIKLETDGSGLGLFIVKSIIERHGGHISFESAEGKGVTFFFTLPIDTSVKESAQQPNTFGTSGL